MTEPQHAPCTEQHHQIGGRQCGQGRCGICDEFYDLGQKISRGDFHWWPDGEYAYWAHVGGSEKHQRILDIQALAQQELLHRTEHEWATLRAESKQYQSPERRRLRIALT